MYRELLVLVLLICCAVSDLRHRTIWWPIVVLTAVAAVPLHAYLKDLTWQQTLVGLIPGLVMFPAAFASDEAVGYGDCLLICTCGMILGFTETTELLFLAFLFSAGVSLVLLLVRKAGRRDSFPFVPLLLAAQMCLMFPHGGIG